MKITQSLLLAAITCGGTTAFQVGQTTASSRSAVVLDAKTTTTTTTTTTQSHNSRRQVMQQLALGGASLFVSASSASAAAPREAWLTEPTEEFKANEAKAMDFKRAQLAIKAQFNKVLERFSTETSEDAIVADLEELKGLVLKTGGLPLGIKKEELFKLIRRKKASGPWTVPTEYAYQGLIREISYQQSPNTEKDEANPL